MSERRTANGCGGVERSAGAALSLRSRGPRATANRRRSARGGALSAVLPGPGNLDTAAGEAVAYALSALSSHLLRCRRFVTIDARLLRQSDH